MHQLDAVYYITLTKNKTKIVHVLQFIYNDMKYHVSIFDLPD